MQQQQLHTQRETSSLMASLSSARCGAVRCGAVGHRLRWLPFTFHWILCVLLYADVFIIKFPWIFIYIFLCCASLRSVLKPALCRPLAPSHAALAQFTLTLPYATHSARLPFPAWLCPALSCPALMTPLHFHTFHSIYRISQIECRFP